MSDAADNTTYNGLIINQNNYNHINVDIENGDIIIIKLATELAGKNKFVLAKVVAVNAEEQTIQTDYTDINNKTTTTPMFLCEKPKCDYFRGYVGPWQLTIDQYKKIRGWPEGQDYILPQY